ncbi:HNH endonuclease signature motif containing protein [Nocardioides sp.]|uniref:HNH endonuclease signature motif containing protein n=1 Tax=Nocardioides sp. TaxID=35761 RepID=UPI002F423B79
MGITAAEQHDRTVVDDLDPSGVLARVSEAETAERRAGLAKLELALQWCVLHPASPDTGTAVWGDAGLPGLDGSDEHLGGEGCPQVAAFAPEPFAAALGVSTFTGMQTLADALDLTHRLPNTWAKVRNLTVAPWKARRLAQATHHLSQQAATYVDEQLADRIDTCGSALIDRIVTQAAARFDPDPVELDEQEAKLSWNVHLTHRADGSFAGTSHLEATGDTLAFTKLYDLVCDHAHHLAELGDLDPLGARKAKALGVIADAQSQLDLFGQAPGESPPVRRPSLSRTRLYLHLTPSDLIDPMVPIGVGEVEKLGPATSRRIKEWLGSSRATVVPVLNLDRAYSVDEHDPPEWMRETVILRDRHCVFPWCRVDARGCDLDHITPYVPIDDGGPPGQTAATKLAPRCRRHHNAKTTGRWQYQRHPDGTYTWQGPHRACYLVTPLGSQALPGRADTSALSGPG